MRKGIALQVPEELFEQIESAAESEYNGDRNEAVVGLITRGLEYEAWRNEWEQASVWRRLKWAVAGWDHDDADAA